MYISLNWIRDFVDIHINPKKNAFKHVVIGHVKSVKPHPNADKLKVAEVDVGEKQPRQIVCGGTNLEKDIYVAVALPGAVLPGNFEIKKAELRGVESDGMICHFSELGLEPKPLEKLKTITPTKKATPGTPLAKTLKQDGLSAQELADLLTLKTAEVEKFEKLGESLDGVVVGEVLKFAKHPDADKLYVSKVDIGKDKPIQVVFGQMIEMHPGKRVPVAVAPTTLPTGLKIDEKEIRGQLTQGMLCLDQELGLAKEGVSIQYFPNHKPGTKVTEALNLNDIIFEIDNKAITHRPDLWGHYGIAREIAALTDKKLKPVNPKVTIPTKGESVKVEIKDLNLCPRYCGLIIENIKVEDSPTWLKQRLLATNHGTHNNIVDVTNYVMAELGQPMHAFDKNYIKGGIIVRRAKGGQDHAKAKEKITALDKKTYELADTMLVIANHEKPVAIAGIIGGENDSINEKTTSIILEAANFNPSSVRKTSTKLNLRTDAVQRFEKALDPLLAETAIKRAAELILQICPSAKIAGPITDVKEFSTTPLKLTLDTEKAKSKIGVDISAAEMKKILESLEFKVEAKGKNFTVTVPSFRATKDVDIEDDLIEEIARIYGYDNIPPSLPTLPTKLPMENTERFKKHRARELLSYGLGFEEVYNYSFYGKKELTNCLLSENGHIKLLNYLSEDQTHLRASMTPNLLKNLEANSKMLEEIRIYEIGRTYKEIASARHERAVSEESGSASSERSEPTKYAYFPLEEKKITGAIALKGKTNQPFYEAKGVVETFFERFNIPKAEVAKGIKETPYAHPIKALTYIDQNAQTLAKVFMLHPLVAKNHELENFSVAIFALNFTELMKMENTERKYRPIPKFPSIEIDVSVIVNPTTEIKTIQEAIEDADKTLIKDIQLFDIYEGDKIDSDKKSIAFKITLQSEERTLTDTEMAEVQSKVFKNLEKIGGVIRGR